MKTFNKALITLSTVLALSACDSTDEAIEEQITAAVEEAKVDAEEKVTETEEKIEEVIEDVEPGKIYGPYATGSVQAPVFVYFDLETMSEVTLSETTDTTWDIALKRTGVYLNDADTDSPVSAYFTNNNNEFILDGVTDVDAFVNATPDSELADFTSVTSTDIPADDNMFVADITSDIIDGFYNYDYITHIVSANAANYFIVNSDTTLTKFNVSDLTTVGYDITEITFSYANQTSEDDAFALTTTDLVVDTALACATHAGVYIDFDSGAYVTESDAWDVSLPCNAGNAGTSFSIDIAADATAIQDFDNSYDAIPVDYIPHYGFKSNEYTVKAFDANSWYKYSLQGNNGIWSQYGVYLIRTATATYKFQITSYYDSEGTSGNISFRAEAL